MRALFQCIRIAVVLGLLTAPNAKAQNPVPFKDWNPASSEVVLKPKFACASLRSLTGYEFSDDHQGRVLTIRKATTPEPEHRQIYATLGITAEVMRPLKSWQVSAGSDEKNSKS